jgi:hypothetical protein
VTNLSPWDHTPRVQHAGQHLHADEYRQCRVNRSPAQSGCDAEAGRDDERGEAEEPVAGQRESPGRKERSGERAPEDEEGRPGLSEPGPPVTPTSRAAPYERMVEGYEQICYSIAAQRLIDYVPANEPG